MNAATFIATILSLVLAGASAANTTGNVTPATARPAPPGVNLNHNETFSHDTAYQTPNVGRFWLTPEQSGTVAPVLIQISKIVGSCSPIVCGSNHNETLISDAR